MTPSELRDEILNGPLKDTLLTPWNAGQDVTVAALLNVKQFRGPVPLEVMSSYCLTNQITGAVVALSEIPIGDIIANGVPMTVQIKSLLHQMLTLIQVDFRLLVADVDDPQFAAGCDGLIGLGLMIGATIMTPTNKTEMIALAANRWSRVDQIKAELGLENLAIGHLDVAAARKVGG